MRIRGWVAVSLLWMWSGLAFAQQPTQAQANAIRQACRADYQSRCASVPTGGSAAMECLQQNASSLSPGCQRALAAASSGGPKPPAPAAPAASSTQQMSPGEKLAIMRRACGGDYRAFCSGVRPGGGQALACLKAHESSLSRRCRVVLQQAASHAGG